MSNEEFEALMNGFSSEEALGLGVIVGGAVVVYLMIVLAVWIFRIIVQWRIFTKAGEPGWKSIIPFYSDYTLFKITWKPVFFWVLIALSFVGGMVEGILATMTATSAEILAILLIAIAVAVIVIVVTQLHKMSKAFGHGIGFTMGLIFLNPIFQIILAFGNSEYKGANL